jgi:hypothetical protein
MSEEGGQGSTDRRPTPVRKAMEAGESQSKGPAAEHRRFLDPESGQEWIASVSGRSTSGVAPLRTISLMEVRFHGAEEQDVPDRRALCLGESVGDLEDDELLEIFRASRPQPPHPSAPPPRGKRGRRDRPRRRN